MSKFTEAVELLEIDRSQAIAAGEVNGDGLDALGISREEWLEFATPILESFAVQYGLSLAITLQLSQIFLDFLVAGVEVGVTYGRLTAEREVPSS